MPSENIAIRRRPTSDGKIEETRIEDGKIKKTDPITAGTDTEKKVITTEEFEKIRENKKLQEFEKGAEEKIKEFKEKKEQEKIQKPENDKKNKERLENLFKPR